jgi:hypothetical protein
MTVGNRRLIEPAAYYETRFGKGSTKGRSSHETDDEQEGHGQIAHKDQGRHNLTVEGGG